MSGHMSRGTTAFFYFQLKDLVTFSVAALGFFVAFVTLRINYLRSPQVRPQLGRTLRLAIPGPKGTVGLGIIADMILFNIGAQPALVDVVRIHLKQRTRWLRRNTAVFLYWSWFLKTEDIAEKGKARQIWTSVDARATAVVVPKYEMTVKEVLFLTSRSIKSGRYKIRIKSLQMNKKRRLRRHRRSYYKSVWRTMWLDSTDTEAIEMQTYLDTDGIRHSHRELVNVNRTYRYGIPDDQEPKGFRFSRRVR
jgi:hypothetical protein